MAESLAIDHLAVMANQHYSARDLSIVDGTLNNAINHLKIRSDSLRRS